MALEDSLMVYTNNARYLDCLTEHQKVFLHRAHKSQPATLLHIERLKLHVSSADLITVSPIIVASRGIVVFSLADELST